jgi:hypothetical protein
MAEGRNRRLWDHTATIAAAALSSFRDKMIDPAKLHPYERGRGRSGKQSIPLTAENIEILKAVFAKDKTSPARKLGTANKEKGK